MDGAIQNASQCLVWAPTCLTTCGMSSQICINASLCSCKI